MYVCMYVCRQGSTHASVDQSDKKILSANISPQEKPRLPTLMQLLCAGVPYRHMTYYTHSPTTLLFNDIQDIQSISADKWRHRVGFNINGYIKKILPRVTDKQTSVFVHPCVCVTFTAAETIDILQFYGDLFGPSAWIECLMTVHVSHFIYFVSKTAVDFGYIWYCRLQETFSDDLHFASYQFNIASILKVQIK
jgi:hypothetical protein